MSTGDSIRNKIVGQHLSTLKVAKCVSYQANANFNTIVYFADFLETDTKHKIEFWQ